MRPLSRNETQARNETQPPTSAATLAVMRVPGFMVKQFYVAGSLRNANGGFELQARNPMGDGHLTSIREFQVDGTKVDPSAVSAIRAGDATWTPATAVSAATPVLFRKGDAVTFHVAGITLSPGRHRLDLDLVERDLGQLLLTLEDNVAQ
jgi:hypothetical protein